MGEKKEVLHLLVLPPQDKPVYFVVKGFATELAEYFYEEHSCPTNYVRCEAIISEGDEDPHGLFEYVRSIPVPADYDEGYEGTRFDKLFPEVKEP